MDSKQSAGKPNECLGVSFFTGSFFTAGSFFSRGNSSDSSSSLIGSNRVGSSSLRSDSTGSNSPVDIMQSAGNPNECFPLSFFTAGSSFTVASSTARSQLTTDERNSSVTLLGFDRVVSAGSAASFGAAGCLGSAGGSGESESIRLSITGLPVRGCFWADADGAGSGSLCSSILGSVLRGFTGFFRGGVLMTMETVRSGELWPNTISSLSDSSSLSDPENSQSGSKS